MKDSSDSNSRRSLFYYIVYILYLSYWLIILLVDRYIDISILLLLIDIDIFILLVDYLISRYGYNYLIDISILLVDYLICDIYLISCYCIFGLFILLVVIDISILFLRDDIRKGA